MLFFSIFCFHKDGNILEVSVTFCKILFLSETFQNIVALVIKDKNPPAYTSEVLDFGVNFGNRCISSVLCMYHVIFKHE